MSRDRWLQLRPDADRAKARNDRTAVYSIDELRSGLTRRIEQGGDVIEVAFLTTYASIRRAALEFRRRGLLVVVADSKGVVGTLVLGSARVGLNSGILGRHAACDLWLSDDSSVSLRHLAVLVYPGASTSPIRYRVMDLRTSLGFLNESGQRVESFETDGPVFAYVGQYTLMLFPLDGRLDWPSDPAMAWNALPQRDYVEMPSSHRWRNRPIKRRRRRAMPDGQASPDNTLVRLMPGPDYVQRRSLAAMDERPLGEMLVHSCGRQTAVVIGARAAAEGVLLGRYDRCDNQGLDALTEASVSRVHLMVIQVADEVWVVDTASTNGIWANGYEVESHCLRFGDRIVLAGTQTELEWRPVS